jgi:hypothetical protein
MLRPGRSLYWSPNAQAISRSNEVEKLQPLKKQKASESPSIQEDKKIKTNDQLTSNSDPPKDSDELPKVEKTRYVWGATEILKSKDPPPEDIWDFCLTAADNPEEIILELSRPNRSPHPK